MTGHTFQRILIALDDSPGYDKTIAYAKPFVNGTGASLALLTVTSVTSPANFGADPLLGQQPIVVPDVSGAQQDGAQRFLQNLRAEFPETQDVKLLNNIGNVRDEILSSAAEWKADLIIMGTNGRTGFDHFLSGSVAESVIRKSTCPVLVIPVGDEEEN